MRDSEDEKTFGLIRDEESDDEIETNSWFTLMEEMESKNATCDRTEIQGCRTITFRFIQIMCTSDLW